MRAPVESDHRRNRTADVMYTRALLYPHMLFLRDQVSCAVELVQQPALRPLILSGSSI